MAKVESKINKEDQKRSLLSQNDVPSMTLDKSPAIVENYTSRPVTPLQAAKAW